MRKNRFNILSLEDFDDSQVDGQVEQSETPVADAIESENSAIELNNEVTAFEEHCEQQNDAIDTVTELQEQVDEQEETIENNPEEVTEQTVEVAQEQFYITMNKITNLSYYGTSSTISHELSAGTPIERLKVSCEGIKEFIGKVIDKIIGFFKAIKNWFVKILQKIGLLKDNEKKAEEILNEIPEDAKDLDEKTIEEAIEELEKEQVDTSSLINIVGFYSDGEGYKGIVDNIIKGSILDIIMVSYVASGALFALYKTYVKELRSGSQNIDDKFVDDYKNQIRKFLIKNGQITPKTKYQKTTFKSIAQKLDNYCPTKFTHSVIEFVGEAKNSNGRFELDSINFSLKDVNLKITKKDESAFVKFMIQNKPQAIKDCKGNFVTLGKIKNESKALETNLKGVEFELENYKQYIDKNSSDLAENLNMKNAAAVGLQFNKLTNKVLTGSIISITDFCKTYMRTIKYVTDVAKKASKKKSKK